MTSGGGGEDSLKGKRVYKVPPWVRGAEDDHPDSGSFSFGGSSVGTVATPRAFFLPMSLLSCSCVSVGPFRRPAITSSRFRLHCTTGGPFFPADAVNDRQEGMAAAASPPGGDRLPEGTIAEYGRARREADGRGDVEEENAALPPPFVYPRRGFGRGKEEADAAARIGGGTRWEVSKHEGSAACGTADVKEEDNEWAWCFSSTPVSGGTRGGLTRSDGGVPSRGVVDPREGGHKRKNPRPLEEDGVVSPLRVDANPLRVSLAGLVLVNDATAGREGLLPMEEEKREGKRDVGHEEGAGAEEEEQEDGGVNGAVVLVLVVGAVVEEEVLGSTRDTPSSPIGDGADWVPGGSSLTGNDTDEETRAIAATVASPPWGSWDNVFPSPIRVDEEENAVYVLGALPSVRFASPARGGRAAVVFAADIDEARCEEEWEISSRTPSFSSPASIKEVSGMRWLLPGG